MEILCSKKYTRQRHIDDKLIKIKYVFENYIRENVFTMATVARNVLLDSL